MSIFGRGEKPHLQLFQPGDSLVFDKERFMTTAEIKVIAAPPNVEMVFNHRSMEKIRALTKACDIEIGALGLMDATQKNGKTILKVYDIFVPEQECSAIVTKMTADGLINLLSELDEEWGFDRAVAIKDKLSYWWHSHVNMGTNPSGQDEREFSSQSLGHQAFCMSIGNKRGDLHVNLKMKVDGFPLTIAQWDIRDVPWSKEWETTIAIKDEVHPLLCKEGESHFRVRIYEDQSAGEILVDPQIEAWAKAQVKNKVKSGFFGGGKYAENSSTVLLPSGGINVKEFYVEKDTDLEQFVIQYFGPQPAYRQVPKVEPKPVATQGAVAALDPAHDQAHDQAVQADHSPGSNGKYAPPIVMRPVPQGSTSRQWWEFPNWAKWCNPLYFAEKSANKNGGCRGAFWGMLYTLATFLWLWPIAWVLICIPTGIGRLIAALFQKSTWQRLGNYIQAKPKDWNGEDAYQRDLENNRNPGKKQEPTPPRSTGKPLEIPKDHKDK